MQRADKALSLLRQRRHNRCCSQTVRDDSSFNQTSSYIDNPLLYPVRPRVIDRARVAKDFILTPQSNQQTIELDKVYTFLAISFYRDDIKQLQIDGSVINIDSINGTSIQVEKIRYISIKVYITVLKVPSKCREIRYYQTRYRHLQILSVVRLAVEFDTKDVYFVLLIHFCAQSTQQLRIELTERILRALEISRGSTRQDAKDELKVLQGLCELRQGGNERDRRVESICQYRDQYYSSMQQDRRDTLVLIELKDIRTLISSN